MKKITSEIYNQEKERYIIVSGYRNGAPTCSYGNIQKWVGYDKTEKKYIRFTKSIFLKLVKEAEL